MAEKNQEVANPIIVSITPKDILEKPSAEFKFKCYCCDTENTVTLSKVSNLPDKCSKCGAHFNWYDMVDYVEKAKRQDQISKSLTAILHQLSPETRRKTLLFVCDIAEGKEVDQKAIDSFVAPLKLKEKMIVRTLINKIKEYKHA